MLINDCLLKDQFRLRRKLRTVSQRLKEGKDGSKLLLGVIDAAQASVELLNSKAEGVPKIEFPAALPIADMVEEVLALTERQDYEFPS